MPSLQTLLAHLPELGLALGWLLVLLYDLFGGPKRGAWLLAALVFAAYIALSYTELGRLTRGEFPLLFQRLLGLSGLLAMTLGVVCQEEKPGQGPRPAEQALLALALVLGLSLMLVAHNLMYLYLGMELSSLCAYLLTASALGGPASRAALRYLLTGGTASAVMLFGMSYLYGLTGTLDYTLMPSALQTYPEPWVPRLALGMLSAGLLFKLAGWPWHVWVREVYNQAPLPLVALFSTAPKVASAWWLSELVGTFSDSVYLAPGLALVAAVSMTWGNILALAQKNLRGILAFSSVSHAGFLLMALVPLDYRLTSRYPLYDYSVTLVLGNMLAFALLAYFPQTDEDLDTLAQKPAGNKALGWAWVLAAATLAGLPPTLGFWGKWALFLPLTQAEPAHMSLYWGLLALGIANTVLAAWYYLKIPKAWFAHGSSTELIPRISWGLGGLVLLLSGLVVLLSVVPGLFLR